MSAQYLVYDIETIPETELVEEWKSSGDYEKDRERQKCEEGEEPFAPQACHKIITIGAMVLDRSLHVLSSEVIAGGAVEGNERAQVEGFNKLAGESHPARALTIVDWNGRKFDMPVIQYRAFRYGIPFKWYYGKLPDNKGGISQWSKDYRDRYGGKHLDLVEEWTNRGAFMKCHLKELAMLMGLPGKTGIDGSMVYGAWKDDRKDDIDNYYLEDVWHTGFVMQRMAYLMGKVSKEDYITAAQLLISHIHDTEGHQDFIDKIDEDLVLLKA